MKFSKTLLENYEIKERIFKNGINKANETIKYIFGSNVFTKIQDTIKSNDKEFFEDISFLNSLDNSLSINKQNYIMQYGVSFYYSERNISFSYGICECESDENLLEELINIREFNIKQEELNIINDDFYKAIDEVEDYLEKQFDLDFTPLNLNIKDENILDITVDSLEQKWTVVFKQEDFEGEYIATFSFNNRILEIAAIRDHKVFLD